MKFFIENNIFHNFRSFSGHSALEYALFRKDLETVSLFPRKDIDAALVPNLFFTADVFTKHANRRSEGAWLQSLIRNPSTVFYAFHKARPIVLRGKQSGKPFLLQLTYSNVKDMLDSAFVTFLGVDERSSPSSPRFAVSLREEGVEYVRSLYTEAYVLERVNHILSFLEEDATVISLVRSIYNWQSQ